MGRTITAIGFIIVQCSLNVAFAQQDKVDLGAVVIEQEVEISVLALRDLVREADTLLSGHEKRNISDHEFLIRGQILKSRIEFAREDAIEKFGENIAAEQNELIDEVLSNTIDRITARQQKAECILEYQTDEGTSVLAYVLC